MISYKGNIALEESRYEVALDEAVERICATDVRLVLISGASCAGKTTTTGKLARRLEKMGHPISLISLDDFYLDAHDTDVTETAKIDVEAPESLDLPYLRECLELLEQGKVALIPQFDFINKRRTDRYTRLQLEENEICLVEGLHALNPTICGSGLLREHIFKLFLSPSPRDIQSAYEDPRFIRRLVRDYHFRGASPHVTFKMWPNVKAGEVKYIMPFVSDADMTINTHFDYEIFVLCTEAMRILGLIPENDRFYGKAKEIRETLSVFEPLDSGAVPHESLLREFIG